MSVPYKKIYFGDYSSQNKNLITSPYQDGGELIVFRKNNNIVKYIVIHYTGMKNLKLAYNL